MAAPETSHASTNAAISIAQNGGLVLPSKRSPPQVSRQRDHEKRLEDHIECNNDGGANASPTSVEIRKYLQVGGNEIGVRVRSAQHSQHLHDDSIDPHVALL